MTCHTCKYEFCWLCRSKYSYKHFAKFNILGCPGSEFIFIIQDMTNSKRAPFSYPNFYRFLDELYDFNSFNELLVIFSKFYMFLLFSLLIIRFLFVLMLFYKDLFSFLKDALLI